ESLKEKKLTSKQEVEVDKSHETHKINDEKNLSGKEETQIILEGRLNDLNDDELKLFEKKMEYENEATSPVFNSRKTYEKADELKQLQNNYSKEAKEKINSLDRDIKDLNNFEKESRGKNLNTNEILRKTKEHSAKRSPEKNKEKDHNFSIDKVKNLDEKVKNETKNKNRSVEKEHEHSV